MPVENLGKEGGKSKGVGMFFKALVQAVLILGAETWVMTPRMGRDLGGVPTQGSSKDHREAAPEVIGRELKIFTAGDGNAGSRV